MTDAPNPRAVLGANHPPDPFAAIDAHVADLMAEAWNWCDGEPIADQPGADAVARLIEAFREAGKLADEARREEARPFDEAKAAVQAKYAPLLAETKAMIGIIPRATTALKAALTPWLRAQEAERLAKAAEARREAEARAQAAAAAMRASDAANMAERAAAEAMVADAEAAARRAKAIEADRSHAHGDGKATGLRRHYRAAMTNRKAALVHYAATRPEALVAFLQGLADADVREGKRAIPGFDVIEEARV